MSLTGSELVGPELEKRAWVWVVCLPFEPRGFKASLSHQLKSVTHNEICEMIVESCNLSTEMGNFLFHDT